MNLVLAAWFIPVGGLKALRVEAVTLLGGGGKNISAPLNPSQVLSFMLPGSHHNN